MIAVLQRVWEDDQSGLPRVIRKDQWPIDTARAHPDRARPGATNLVGGQVNHISVHTKNPLGLRYHRYSSCNPL